MGELRERAKHEMTEEKQREKGCRAMLLLSRKKNRNR